MDWIQKTRAYLRDNKITQEAMAERLGITQGALGHWLNKRREPSLDDLKRLAAEMGMDITQLLSDAAAPAKPMYELQPASVWDDDTPVEDDEVEVPFYKEVEFSAGSGTTHGLEINGRRVRYGRSSLRAAGVDPHNAACGKATGNSMEPLIQDGSLVGIDRGKTQIVDGEIYAIDHDGMLRVKYVYRLPGGGIRLRSFNQEEHPDETYSAEDAQRIKILGWVWTWSPPIRKWRGK